MGGSIAICNGVCCRIVLPWSSEMDDRPSIGLVRAYVVGAKLAPSDSDWYSYYAAHLGHTDACYSHAHGNPNGYTSHRPVFPFWLRIRSIIHLAGQQKPAAPRTA